MPARLTKKQFNDLLLEKGIEILGHYVGDYTNATFRCACGHQWVSQPFTVLKHGKCPRCAGNGIG